MINRIWEALPALVVLFFGLFLALTVRNDGLVATTIAVVSSIAIGIAATIIGSKVLLPFHPKCAVVAITGGLVLSVGAAAAAGTAVIIYGNVAFDVDQTGVTGLDAGLVKAFWAGVSAFLTVVFVKAAETTDLFGEAVKNAFHAKFTDTRGRAPGADVPLDQYPMVGGQSKLESWIFQEVVDGVGGWGWRARWKRAETVSKLIRDEAERRLVNAYRRKPAEESDAGRDVRATHLDNKPDGSPSRSADQSTLDDSDS